MPADDLWGKSVWETDELLHQKHGDPQLRVACVGRSAEAGCLYAAIINDLHRAAGRSGVGTVMASKNLKAVTVRGTRGVGNIKDPMRFLRVTSEQKQVLADNAVTGQGLPAMGTQVLMNVHQRGRGNAHPQHARSAVRGCAQDLGRSDAGATRRRQRPT